MDTWLRMVLKCGIRHTSELLLLRNSYGGRRDSPQPKLSALFTSATTCPHVATFRSTRSFPRPSLLQLCLWCMSQRIDDLAAFAIRSQQMGNHQTRQGKK